ncbi:MAG: nitrilase-related carbon-nitrogen hydrolase [Ilumatobacter sp.]|jgi:N-carbamoylputrescine amidase|uniref:nitrilase-related carbon-nitrogen hydrolase n=1 Tax=Ilumatobacter sp. TaxID=1967498 RepID=UPI00391DE242
MTTFDVRTHVDEALPSPFRTEAPTRPPLRVGAVQCAWSADSDELCARVSEGVAIAAEAGATFVALQELTLSPYFCVDDDVDDAVDRFAEDLETGPTAALARELAVCHGIHVHASLFERVEATTSCDDRPRGYNTAICVDAAGEVVSRTRKTHIPEFPYYWEDRYFEPSDADAGVVDVDGASFAFPTCWDQWFPELARCLSLDGAEVIVYPTAIGNEPHVPDCDSQPMWHQMITANGLANATFMIAVNRIGTEGALTFYGSSFISDPYGRTLVEASRDTPTVLVADLDLDQRRDWLSFGLLYTRRPDRYGRLMQTSDLGRPLTRRGDTGADGAGQPLGSDPRCSGGGSTSGV